MTVLRMDAPPSAKDTDEWQTPLVLFDALDKAYRFDIDAAASASNALCPRFFTAADNALVQEWASCRVFLNPPYSRGLVDLFMQKAADEADKGATVVAVLRGDFSTEWWHTYVKRARRLVLLKGRVRFVHPDKGLAGNSPTFATAIAVFEKRVGEMQLAWWDWKAEPFPSFRRPCRGSNSVVVDPRDEIGRCMYCYEMRSARYDGHFWRIHPHDVEA